ncbi:MAG: sigma-70 family RNA polymerase sigma factor [Vicinamibacterales bacterium]
MGVDPQTDLELARAGDGDAIERLFERYRGSLRRWARGRLPQWARDMADTEDLLQETLTQTLKQLPRIDLKDEHALLAYLRQAVLNRIRNELRRASRHPGRTQLDFTAPDGAASPLEAAIGRQQLDRYEDALASLTVSDREAIIGRVELGLSYKELAGAMRKSSADAARVAVTRAIVRLATRMRKLGEQ